MLPGKQALSAQPSAFLTMGQTFGFGQQAFLLGRTEPVSRITL